MPPEKKPTTEVPPRSQPAPYATPRLRVYGALAEITRARGNKSIKDGGAVFGQKRSAI
jgi:hypothetical protein